MKKIEKLLFISLLIVTVNSLFGQNYNYKNTIIYVPESEINYLKNGKILNEPYYFSEQRIRYMPINELDTVPLSILEILYVHIPKGAYHSLISFNQYDTLKTQEEIYKQKKTTLYYLGIIPINSEYESYIFMIDIYFPSEDIYLPSEDAYLNRGFYMLNIRNERLVSVYEIASYLLHWGHVLHNYTIIEPPNILIRKLTFEDSTQVYLQEEYRQRMAELQRQEEERNTTKYKIDAQGFIELISE